MMHKIKVGVVGLHFGHEIIRDHLRGGGEAGRYFELVSVCDRVRGKADDIAASYGVRACYDIAEMLADPEIEAVCLMVGPAGRARIMEQIVRAGKHIMTTKPLEVNAAAALSVLRLARDRGLAVHLNSPAPQLWPGLSQIKQWQREFNLGRPIAARADVWSKYVETADGSWYDDPSQCPVAPIFRIGIYLINDLISIFGQPEFVSVMQSRIFTGRPTPDNAQLGIRFKGGALANVFASFSIDDGQRWLNPMTINYQDGTVYCNVLPNISDSPRNKPELTLVTRQDGKPVRRTVVVDSGPEDYQWEAFHRAIRGEEIKDETSPEQIVAGIRVIEAMVRATQSGRVEEVKVDSDRNGARRSRDSGERSPGSLLVETNS